MPWKSGRVVGKGRVVVGVVVSRRLVEDKGRGGRRRSLASAI